jgi:hypothetical protein
VMAAAERLLTDRTRSVTGWLEGPEGVAPAGVPGAVVPETTEVSQ